MKRQTLCEEGREVLQKTNNEMENPPVPCRKYIFQMVPWSIAMLVY